MFQSVPKADTKKLVKQRIEEDLKNPLLHKDAASCEIAILFVFLLKKLFPNSQSFGKSFQVLSKLIISDADLPVVLTGIGATILRHEERFEAQEIEEFLEKSLKEDFAKILNHILKLRRILRKEQAINSYEEEPQEILFILIAISLCDLDLILKDLSVNPKLNVQAHIKTLRDLELKVRKLSDAALSFITSSGKKSGESMMSQSRKFTCSPIFLLNEKLSHLVKDCILLLPKEEQKRFNA